MAVNPAMGLDQGPPVAQPSVVLVGRAVVGFKAVPQTIPLTVTVAPPLEEMVPPPVAVVEVMLVTGVVVTTVGVVTHMAGAIPETAGVEYADEPETFEARTV